MDGKGWKVTAASVEGTAHVRQNLPCQDAHGYRLLPGDLLLVAIADGAGSASEAAEGATRAVQSVLATLAESLQSAFPHDETAWQARLRDAFVAARDQIVELATGRDQHGADYATTLACAVATPEYLVGAQIGDGTIVAREAAGTLFTVVRPRRGEYVNETHFLTSEAMLDHLDVQVCRTPVDALVAMTDGLIDLALRRVDAAPHPPFFHPLLTFNDRAEDRALAAEALADFLASDRVCARTDDDKTLLLATWHGPAGEGQPPAT